MAISGIIKAWGDYRATKKSNEQAKRQEEAFNRFRDENIQKMKDSTLKGADELSNMYGRQVQDFKDNPLYNPEQLSSYEDLTRQSNTGSTLYGDGVSYQDALKRTMDNMGTGREARTFSYDPTQLASVTGEAAQTDFTSSGRGMRASQLQDSDLQSLHQQQALRDDLGAAARGETPSIANQSLLAGMERAAQQQAGLAAQARGGANSLLMQRQAAQMGNQGMQNVAREGAMMSLDERERARQAYGQQLAGMRAAATERDFTQAQLDQQAEQINLNQRMSEAARRDQIGLANTQNVNLMNQFNLGNEMASRQFNAANQTAADAAYADNRMATDRFNISRGDALANQKAQVALDALGREVAAKSSIDSSNAQFRERANSQNAQVQLGLLDRQNSMAEQKAFADRSAAESALGIGQKTNDRKDPWAGTINAVGDAAGDAEKVLMKAMGGG